MRQGKKSFRHESLQDAATIKEILRSIFNGFAKGRITFSDEDDEMVMDPRGLLHMRIKAGQEDDRDQISIRVSWQRDDRSVKRNKSLKVTGG